MIDLTGGLAAPGMTYLSVAVAVVVLLHYLMSMDRVRWPIKKSPAV